MKKLICLFCVLCLMIIPIYSGGMTKSNIYAEDNDLLASSAKSALLMDYNSNTIIYERNAKTRLPIASIVKLMTILLTYEAIENNALSLDTMITTSENASGMGGSQVFIDPYVEYKTEDLLKSVIMASANDASVALAEHIAGSESEFVNLMNKRAKELGMDNTLYVNCTGLPAPEQYSCAYDCAIVLKEVTKFEHYHTISNVWMDKLVHPSGRETELVNTNKLVRYYKGCDSGKTGSTSEAGYCLSASAIKNDFRLIAVVIGAKTGQERFTDVSNLFNYGFANFENKDILDCNIPVIKDYEILKSKNKVADIYASESYYGLCKKGDNSEYEISYEIGKLKAPIKAGEKVGLLTISKGGNVVKEIDLIVKNNIEQLSYFDGIKYIAENW